MRKGYSEYNNRLLFDLLNSAKTKYATLNNHVLKEIMVRLDEPPSLVTFINEYLSRYAQKGHENHTTTKLYRYLIRE